MILGTGCGLYAAGICISTSGGAFSVIEKRPRRTGRQILEVDEDGIEDTVPEYEDVLRIVGIERLHGSLHAMVQTVATRLGAEPLRNDVIATLELADEGEEVRRMFYEYEACPNHAVSVRGEQPTPVVIPLRVLQTHAMVTMQAERLEALEGLADSRALLGRLDRLESLEPGRPRDVAIATALAIWTANRYPTRGPWASNKPPNLSAPDPAMRELRMLALIGRASL
jgi:hypothetical protein